MEVTFDVNGDQLFTCVLKKDCGTYPAYVITPDGTNVFYLRRKLALILCKYVEQIFEFYPKLGLNKFVKLV